MSWNFKRELVPLAMIAAIAALAAIYGPGLPDSVPSHFDGNGNADGHMSRTAFLLVIPAVVVGLYLLLTFLPFIDPLWKRIQSRYSTLLLLRDFTLGFMVLMFVISLLAARDGRFSVTALGVGLGILFMLIGNYLPKIPRNWFFGIRTPWTMSSDEIWKRSHIVGGWWFVGAGFLIAVLSFTGLSLQVLLLVVLGPTVVVTGWLYPYMLFKRAERDETSIEPADRNESGA